MVSKLVLTSRFQNKRQRQLLLLGLSVPASLFMTLVQAGGQKETGTGTAPSSSQVNQADACGEITPAQLSSHLETSQQLLLPDAVCGLSTNSEIRGEGQAVMPPKKAAACGRKQRTKKAATKPRSSRDKTTADSTSALEKLRNVRVPDSASEALNQLADTLERKGIHCESLFIAMIEKVVAWELAGASGESPLPKKKGPGKAGTQVNPEEALTTLSTLIFQQKADTFFSHMKQGGTTDSRYSKSTQLSTSSLTTVVRSRRKDITSFVQCSDELLKEAAQLETLRALTSLYTHRGFPGTLERFREFETLFGEDEGKIPGKYRKNFISMQNGRGVPTKKRILGFWQWIKSNNLEPIMASLASVLNGRGIPDPENTRSSSPMSTLKGFVELFGDEDKQKQIPRRYLPNFTAMQNGKGVPAKERVWEFWQWIKDNDLESDMMSLSSLLGGRGIPDPGNTNPDSPISALTDFVGLFGQGDNLIPSCHLSHFTAMQNSKGMPAGERVWGFWQWVKVNGLEAVMPSLSGLLRGCGIPDPNNTNSYSAMSVLKGFLGQFGDGEAQTRPVSMEE